MPINLTPRFYYSLSTFEYFLSSLNLGKASPNNVIFSALSKSKTCFAINARTLLRVLLSSISKQQLNIGVQAYTCHTVFQAINKAGHKIVFLDINDHFKLDLECLKSNINNIDVLIITHTFGLPENLDAITRIARGKIIIEDCSHSFLSKYNGQYTGTFGDAAVFSTGLAKFPPIGTGGFCLINSEDKFPYLESELEKIPKPSLSLSLKDFIKSLVFSVMMKKPFYGLITHRLGKKYDSKLDFGNKFNYEEYQGYKWAQAMFLNNDHIFNRLLQHQKKNALLLSFLIPVIHNKAFTEKNNDPNFYLFPLLIKNRDSLADELLNHGVEPGKHFHKSIDWAYKFGYQKGGCPNSELIIKNIITVPIHYGVAKKRLLLIAKLINNHYNRYA